MKNVLNFVDELEIAQTISMKKRGHFTREQFWNEFYSNSYKMCGKKLPKLCKSYKTRRAAIKKGCLGAKARFGAVGCSSYWW